MIKLTDKISCENAYWVEGLNYNLLSVAQLNRTGYRVEFHHKKAKIFDATSELIGSGEQTRGNLFYLDLSKETCMIAQLDNIWLWHKRLCHVNFYNLVEISKKKKVRGLPRLKKPENVMCKECQLGKMTKSSFKRKSFTSENILDLVHTNLLFVDDHTRMMHVMFLKEKSNAF